MGKRKSKKNTLTKIDLSILKPKPFAISQHASHNGARVTTILNLVRVPPAPPTDPPASDLDPAGLNGDFEEEENDEVEGDRGEDVSKGPRAARDNPLLLWRAERDLFLKEFIRLEGRGATANGRCELCRKEGTYRCVDCIAIQLLCGECLTRVHSSNPFHAVEKWNGSYFERSSLRQAGHFLQLGHHPADQCTSPQRSTKLFTVIHTNGIHTVDLAFCGCSEIGQHGTRVQQLLRRRLFPATVTDPQTACTFSLLESAQLLTLQSKLSPHAYYVYIKKLTDATGTVKVGDRYKSFLQSLRMWREITMAEHGGSLYDSTGTESFNLASQSAHTPML